MTPAEYGDWSLMHMELFMMRDAADASLLNRWAKVLMPFTFADLKEASYAVATDPSDKARFRQNHLAMLREVVLAKHAEAAARERERFDRQAETAECLDCNGVGLVQVPHPDFVLDGEMQRGMFLSVACLCAVGTQRFNAVNARLTEAGNKERMIDVAEYEHDAPDWRTTMATYTERRAQEFASAELASQADHAAPIDMATVRDIIERAGNGR